MVKTPFEHFQFRQKWDIFERFEKKIVQKWLEPIHHNMVFDHINAKNAMLFKNSNFLLFKNQPFLMFSGVLDV